MTLLKKLKLYSIIIVPVLGPEQFLDLEYSKIKPNIVSLEKDIALTVDNSASPLFYKFKKVQVHSELNIEGSVSIKKALNSEEKDTYFQIGVIYSGDYRPNFFVKKILPEWLLKILNINKEYGVGKIDFLHVTNNNTMLDKKESIRDIQMTFKTVSKMENDGTFKFSTKLRKQKILGLWLRADGDDHKASFKTSLSKVLIK